MPKMGDHEAIAQIIHSASGDMIRSARKLERSSDNWHARGKQGHSDMLADHARLWRAAAAEVRELAERYRVEHVPPPVDLDAAAG